MALKIASQLPEAFTSLLARGVPDIEIVPVPRGVPPSLDSGTEVLVAAPYSRGEERRAPRPAGWPFGLRWVQLISVGIDFYPDWLFDGPVVTSVRGASSVALAEYALAAILAHAKRFPELFVTAPEQRASRPLDTVAGQTLGLLGFGSIGAALAPRAQALGLTVIANRRTTRVPDVPGVELVSLPELAARSDHLLLAAPLTDETERIVDARFLGQAKPGLNIINVARGALIDDQALLDALDDGRVARATLDVTHPEPLPAGHPFYTHPRVHLSPHTAVSTPDTREKLAARFADNVARYRAGLDLADIVDVGRGY
jgi:phosphoglycerate dehydrogenase-like enzyme